MNKDEVADTLEEYAEFLELDGQFGRAKGYEKAADAVRMSSYLPSNHSKLNGIGDATREAVIDLECDRGIDELEELRERYPWYESFRGVKHIGPSRAEQIHEKLHIETLDKLIMAGENGDLTIISGIGSATEEKILKSAKQQ
jgi:DNA polymerase (family 10)